MANEESDTVSVLDAASFKTMTTVRVGQMPHNVQVSPNGSRVWVTNNVEPAPAGASPVPQGMAKGGNAAMPKPGAVWAIDTGSGALVAKVPVGLHPTHIVQTPDGRFADVTNGGDNTVSVIDASAQRVVATIPVGKFPHGIRFSQDGKHAIPAVLPREQRSSP